VGGVALLSYVKGRNTQDVDLLLDGADLDRIGWIVTGRDRDFARADFDGLRVDLRLTDNALFAHVRQTRAATATFGDRTVPCASREGLLLLKLYALPSLYRQGEFARAALYETDILMLHQGAAVDDEALLAELRPYMAVGDVVELRSILAEQRGAAASARRRRQPSAADDMDAARSDELGAREDPRVPRHLRAAVEDHEPSLVEAERVEVARELLQPLGLGGGPAAHLELQRDSLRLPGDEQVEGVAAQGVLAVDASAAVHDPLEEGHQHEVRPRLLVDEAVGRLVPVLAPELLPRRQELRHVEQAVRTHVPRGLLWIVVCVTWVRARGITSR